MIMEQMDFSIELSESEIEKFADYLYQKENAKATINKYMDVSLAPRPQMNPRISFPYLARRKPCGKCSTWVVRMGLA